MVTVRQGRAKAAGRLFPGVCLWFNACRREVLGYRPSKPAAPFGGNLQVRKAS